MPEPGDRAVGNMAGSGGLLHREGQSMRIALGKQPVKQADEAGDGADGADDPHRLPMHGRAEVGLGGFEVDTDLRDFLLKPQLGLLDLSTDDFDLLLQPQLGLAHVCTAGNLARPRPTLLQLPDRVHDQAEPGAIVRCVVDLFGKLEGECHGAGAVAAQRVYAFDVAQSIAAV